MLIIHKSHTFVVHVPVGLPDGVVIRAGRGSGWEVRGHAAYHRPLHLWAGNPPRGDDLTAKALQPERRVVEVVVGTDQ